MATEELQRTAARSWPSAVPASGAGTTEILVTLADGRPIRLPAWRCRRDLPGVPAIGAIRLAAAPPPDAGAAQALSILLQCAAFHLPYGGAWGGIAVDAAGLDRADLPRAVAAYGRAFPDMALVVPGPAGPGTVLAGWPGAPGGGPSPDEAVARTAAAALARLHPGPGTWALAGYDRAALHLARLLQAAGWRLRAASDGTAAVANRHGLTASELASAMGGAGSLAALAGERGTLRIDDIWSAGADLVVVAGRVRLGAAAALRLGGATVVELAPLAVTAEAEALLAAQGARFVPELVAGAGAPILAHLRAVRRRHRRDWPADELRARLLRRFDGRLAALLEQGGDLRLAALRAATGFVDSLGSGAVVRPL